MSREVETTASPPPAPSGEREENAFAAEPAPDRRALLRLFGLVAGLLLAIGATYVIPALSSLRPWVPGGGYVPFWNLIGREWLGEGALLEREQAEVAKLSRLTAVPAAPPASAAPRPAAPAPVDRAVFPPYSPATRVPAPEVRIEPSEALDPYYRRLTLVDLGVEGAVARASHWGDSVLGLDGITSRIRRRLQARFGDAGHGFHLVDRYNPSYQQQDVTFDPAGGWFHCFVVRGCKTTKYHFGYGGLAVNSPGGGISTFGTTREGFGSAVSRFELWFSRREKGGQFEILVDGKDAHVVDTRGPDLEDGWHEVRVTRGTHSFRLRALGRGAVHAYGVVLENDGPGVVWDGMALIGGSTRGLRTQDPDHIASQVRHRDPDLLVFLFGGNDMERNYVDLKESMQLYYDEFGDVLRHFRAGKPGLPCLIMSVMDHGKRTAGDWVVSRPFAKTLSRAQGEVARQNGCGFFDTYLAMGGEGSAGRWARANPRLLSPDLGHPTVFGYDVISGLVTDALLYGYEEYRARMAGKPLPELNVRRGAEPHAPE